MPVTLQRPPFASSLKESLFLPAMSVEEEAAFRQERAQARQPLVVPTVLLAILMMSAFAFWDIAREGGLGTSAMTRLAGAAAMVALLAAVRHWRGLSLRLQLIVLYLGFYGWQLAIGTTLDEAAPQQLPGLIVIMFGSVLALLHASDARINLLLAMISVPAVLPQAPTLENWLYAIGLLGTTVGLVALCGAQMERSYALGHLFHLRLQREARTDPLTGLHNRRALDAVLRREMSRCERTGVALSVAVIDLDHFKAVNDRWGHDAGDQVLREVAELLRRGARSTDTLVRLGGEEFGLVMVDTPQTSALVLVERLRRSIEAHPFHSGALRCTMSAGVAERWVGDPDWEAIYQRADRALYVAKVQGRNRAAGAEPA